MPLVSLLYADLEGYVTYKLFAEFTNPTDELSAIYSDAVVLGTAPFYIDAPCGCFNPELGDVLLGADQNPAFFVVLPEVQYDSYWTLGFLSESNRRNSQSLTIQTGFSTMCSEQEDGGLIFTVVPEEAGDDLRIQFAQVTTCGSFEFHACFSVFVNGNQCQNEFWCMGDFVNDGEWNWTAMVPHS